MNAVLRDIASLADGYLGAMIRESHCDVIEAVQHTWLAWALSEYDAGRTFARWQDAWHGWLAEQAELTSVTR